MQTIYLDISNKGAIPAIHAKQGDVGRKFLAVITDSGVPQVLDSSNLFSVWYDGDSGEGNYSEIDGKSAFSVNGNKVVVELVTQMLTNPGKGILSLIINDPAGYQIGLWNIDYIVEPVPGIDSPEADHYYTAFLGAIKEMAVVGVESPSFPGCYYRVVNGETEWLNPPMTVDVEYRTAERYNGKPVYAKAISYGALPSTGTVSIHYQSDGDHVVDLQLIASQPNGSGNNYFTFPLVWGDDGTIAARSFIQTYQGSSARLRVVIHVYKDLSDYTVQGIIKYTK